MLQLIKTIILLSLVSSYLNAVDIQGDIKAVKKVINEAYTHVSKTRKTKDNYSKYGANEFWSNGGFLQYYNNSMKKGNKYEMARVKPRYIEVTILVPGQAAVAMYYVEGWYRLQNEWQGLLLQEGVKFSHKEYSVRISQTFVKEDDTWKVRSSHYSKKDGISAYKPDF